jgi:hemolysin activation/secretion protein
MSRCFLLFFVVFLAGMLTKPEFVLGDVSSEAEKELISQTDMSRQINEGLGLQQEKKPEIHVKKEKPAPKSQGPSFKINDIVLEGNTVFTTQQLRVYIKSYEGRVLFLKDLQDLANLITAHYQRTGYLTSRAYIPPQKIQNGIVVIRIVEGRIANIIMKGNRWFSDRLYLDKLSLKQGQLFYIQKLTMSLQDINQLPDRSVKAYLEPGTEPGTFDVDIVAQDQVPLHASYEYNTNGSELTHLSRHILHLTDNNLTGNGDTLQTSLSLGEQNELLGGAMQYALPMPEQGVVYSLNAGGAYSRLGKELRPLKVTADSFFVSPGVTKNFIKDPTFKLDGFLDFEIKDSKSMEDNSRLTYDRDRVLDIGPRVAIDDSMGKTFLAGDLRGGIPDFLGGAELHAPSASRIDSGGEFIYMTGSVDRINRLPYGSYLVLHGGGQYSPMPLTSFEQFYLGGMNSVRGYPENDSSGDSGVNFSTEVRIPIYFIPKEWHVGISKDKTWRDSLSFVTFVDGGRVFNYNRQGAGSALDRTLLSTGVGLNFYMTPDMNCQAGIGFPFGATPTSGDPHDQIYVMARVGF